VLPFCTALTQVFLGDGVIHLPPLRHVTREFETRQKLWATTCSATTTLLGTLRKKKYKREPDLPQNYATCSLALKKKAALVLWTRWHPGPNPARYSAIPANANHPQCPSTTGDNWQSSLTGGMRHLISSGLYFGEMHSPPSRIRARHCSRKQILWTRKRNRAAQGRKLKTFSPSQASFVLVISPIVTKITHMVSVQRQDWNVRKIPTTNSAQVFQGFFFPGYMMLLNHNSWIS